MAFALDDGSASSDTSSTRGLPVRSVRPLRDALFLEALVERDDPIERFVLREALDPRSARMFVARTREPRRMAMRANDQKPTVPLERVETHLIDRRAVDLESDGESFTGGQRLRSSLRRARNRTSPQRLP